MEKVWVSYLLSMAKGRSRCRRMEKVWVSYLLSLL
jgi:hypothetical protein